MLHNPVVIIAIRSSQKGYAPRHEVQDKDNLKKK